MKKQTIILFFAIVIIALGIIFLQRSKGIPAVSEISESVAKENAPSIKKMQYPQARELAGIGGYLNTDNQEIKISDLIGKKVILIDFWTYSCINCQRTLPYLISWYEKYKDQGLEVIGVHTPEFDFEKRQENVQAALLKWGITYPVVLDNDYATWRAYGNQYWPRKYLIDIDGYVVYDHIGEGGYEQTERQIQDALTERANRLSMDEDISSDTVRVESDLVSGGAVASPEIYFGAMRNAKYAGARGVIGTQTLAVPQNPKSNTLYLVGDWDIQEEYATPISENAKIIFKYNAQDVYAVASSGEARFIHVSRDGADLGSAAGSDMVNGSASIKDETLYRLVEDIKSGEHVLEIEVPIGVEFYTFTFG
ncbi:MAG: thiol-disulfide isomerase [Parcubacteria group bacterium CG10_big_fil_rev_8_21_14_0_10_41_35]|nr:MAG: thiol-disulfide isomerase [Parcubacteria group bacterium CG10_big_fil_rev_8_21_14_0_10_41_35]